MNFAAAASTASGDRFAFGRNWERYLKQIDDERIRLAKESLRDMVAGDLEGRTFLDVGCGSGLFSLAAMRLRAGRVHSFDVDAQSVGCAAELRRRYFPNAENWTIDEGSVLDSGDVARLGQYDVVYSWGVLHHTGDLWSALANVAKLVAPSGRLVIALYTDHDVYSRFWKRVKKQYSRHAVLRPAIVAVFGGYFVIRGLLKDLLTLSDPTKRYREYKKTRGMSYFVDLLDWLGGYPFEVSKPGDVLDFFRGRGFELIKLRAAGRFNGNDEYVFLRRSQ